jgi:peptide/nickel transport system substrate-binding protein
MRMVRSPSLRLFLIDMDTARAPFNDLQVRRAVAYAIDRTSMLARVLHGAGVLADEWLPSWSWAYVAGLPHYDFNPVKAASLLDADGWKLSADGVRVKNGQRLSIVFVGPQGSGDFKAGAELIQSFLKDVGFDVAIKLYPYGIVYDPSGPVKKGNFDLAYYSFSVNYDPSALDYDGCDRFPPRGVNDERYCDPVVDRDERLSLMTNDPARRKALFSDVERRRLLDLASFPLYFVDRVGIVTDRLQNYAPSRGIVPEWNAWRWSLR